MSTVETLIADRVHELQDYIKAGRVLDAMKEFYAPNCSMQENNEPPVVGLGPNIEREKQFLAQVKTWISYEPLTICVGPDASAVESSIEFINTEGKNIKMAEVAIQHWRDGKIIREKFYYDTRQH
jgi:hypothetical protein